MKPVFKILITSALVIFFAFQIAVLKPNYERARARALDALQPDAFDVLVAAVEHHQPLDRETLMAYLRYFQEVAQLTPQRADAVGMQGFCYYHLGEYDRAMESYMKATRLVPEFFGFHYNLAAIYFKSGQYGKAADELNKIQSLDPRVSLAYILSSSKIYGMVMLSQMKALGRPVEQQFEENYQKAFQLMMATQYHLQKKEALPGEDKLSLEVF